MLTHIKVLFILVNLVCFSYGYFGRNWIEWERAKKMIQREIETKRVIGLTKQQYLKRFDLFTYGLKLSINNKYRMVKQDIQKDLNLINGRSVVLKPVNNEVIVEIKMPMRKLNTCGLIIKSSVEYGSGQFANVTMYWKKELGSKYQFITRPDTGSKVYPLKLNAKESLGLMFFDSIPAKYFAMKFYTNKGTAKVNLRIASLNKCIFNKRHIIKDCGERLENNIRFKSAPYGEPIQILCPIDCIRTWPCWGYRIYSSDSPICWTATQSMGRWGNGEYTMYKIPKVYYFRQITNLAEGHGIFCKKTTTAYPAFTFQRKYYDFAISEAKKFEEMKKKM